MSTKVDKLVKTYKALSQIPAVASAYIRSNNIINTSWTQRNLEKGKNTEFTRDFFISKDLKKIAESLPVDVSTEIISKTSKSEKFRAVLRDYDSKQFLEIWQDHNLVRSVDLNTLDVHGPVYADGEFASFEWSPDETKILYVAEKKKTKTEPFYKRKAPTTPNEGDSGNGTATKTEEKSRGEEYLFSQDWGEQLVGKKFSVIAQYDIESDNVEILKGIPDNVFPAQPKYSPDGSYIIGTAYELEPRKLGLIYCSNRPSTIFYLNFEGTYAALPLKNVSVKSPIISPNGDCTLWLQRTDGGPHAACLQLIKAKLPLTSESTGEVLIDIADNEKKTIDGKPFYGLYNTGFIRRPWASQNRLIINTLQKYTINSYVIDTYSGSITQLPSEDGSLRVVDVHQDLIVAVQRHFLKPDKIVIGRLPPPAKETEMVWEDLTTSIIIPSLQDCKYEYLDLKAPEGDISDFNAIYLGPKTGNKESVPLLMWPHGGPHSSFGNWNFLEANMFLSYGFGIILINYRGSIGCGQKNVEFIVGKIGTTDVQDCIQATDEALKRYPWLNPNKVALTGGSHGGFLVTHLSGQYPDKYKVVVARNPVIDVASMSITSDIPDWCYVETGYDYTQKGEMDNKVLEIMRNVSPIVHAHKVKAPTLLQIGSKDLRVPCHQGIEYYHRLKANGIKTRMNLYEDNHSINSLPHELDNILNSILWIGSHLGIEE